MFFYKDDRCNQIAADHEKNEADIAIAKRLESCMKKDNRQDSNSSQAVNYSAIAQFGTLYRDYVRYFKARNLGVLTWYMKGMHSGYGALTLPNPKSASISLIMDAQAFIFVSF